MQQQENLRKMQEITSLLQNRAIPEKEIEETDEFDNYMEQSLMAEANQMGIF